jgi:TonB-dependent SusC/RagA subfamily outer membrane receptor
MLALSYYLLKVIVCSGVLLGYYWLALRNKIYHQYNRFYLLAVVVLSLLLPVIKINFWQSDTTEQPAAINILQAVSNADVYVDELVQNDIPTFWNSIDWLSVGYFGISIFMLLLLLQSLLNIYKLLRRYPTQKINAVKFLNTNAKNTPFSFLNYIFWNSNIDANSPSGKHIFKHELAHVQQLHTYDKLCLNIILIIFWCNPFFWLLRKELYMIHEFIADKKAVEDSDTAAFAAMILQATYPQHQFSIANNFFYSPIKRRLAMLVKNKNPKVSYWSRLLVLPVAGLLFAAFTLKTKETTPTSYNGKKVIVVIDAGHGGEKDPGAKSNTGIAEKDLALAIAKKVKALNDNDKIEIILTRESDVYMTPQEKANFTNEKNADVFISLHTDGSAKPNTTSGITFFVAQDKFGNARESKVLAAVLIDEFLQGYALPVDATPKQREAGIWVLQASKCPSVLIETGVINNDTDYEYLNTIAAQETIAQNVLKSVNRYLNTKNISNEKNESPSDEAYAAANGVLINVKNSDTNYLRSVNYKTKALVIIDGKEIGNYGADYLEKNKINYSTVAVFAPEKAVNQFGAKGKFGVIQLTKNAAVVFTVDSIYYDANKQKLSLITKKNTVNENFNDALILLDGKEITMEELNKINPEKILSIHVIKGEKLQDFVNAKGKQSVIQITLRTHDLPAVTVTATTKKPLFVLDGQVQDANFGIENFDKQKIKQLNVLKGDSALKFYGKLGINGVIEITTTQRTLSPEVITIPKSEKPLYVVDGVIAQNVEDAEKINPEHIQTINVLKGESATALYGEKGKNGVVLITTKMQDKKPNKEVTVTGFSAKKHTPVKVKLYANQLTKIVWSAEKNKYDVMMHVTNGTVTGGDGFYNVLLQKNGTLKVSVLIKGTPHILQIVNFEALESNNAATPAPVINLDEYLKKPLTS